MRFTLDTNILVYAHDADAGARHRVARDVVTRALDGECVLMLQALAETYSVLVNRRRLSPSDAAAIVRDLRDLFPVHAADEAALLDAMAAVQDHQASFWDAMIWATARQAGCRLILSEDGQDGRQLLGVTVVNPFADRPSPLIDQALSGAR